MEILDKNIEIMSLYDIYQNVLTSKQREYIESYYFEDLSITEISEEFGVSRNAVHDQIKKTVKKLYDLESNMMIKDRTSKRKKLIDKIRLVSTQDEVKDILDELEKVE